MQTLRLQQGDSIEILRSMPEGSVGAFIADPPYGLEFLGAEWDGPGNWQNGAGFSSLGLGGSRRVPLPSFTGGRFGAANPTCKTCGGRLRGRRRCTCSTPSWKPLGKRKGADGPPPEDPTFGDTSRYSKQFGAWCQTWLVECRRVLVPGGLIKVFGATRMFHRLACAMEFAGFTLEPFEAWVYISGMPKSLNVSAALDKTAGSDPDTDRAIQGHLRERRTALGLTKGEIDRRVFGGTTRYSWVEGRGGERADEVYLPTPEEWVGLKAVLQLDDRFDAYIKAAVPSREFRARVDGGKGLLIREEEGDFGYQSEGERWDGTRRVTEPVSDAAKQFAGFGTALKPSWEPFLVGRKA